MSDYLSELRSTIQDNPASFGYTQKDILIKSGIGIIDYLNGEITVNDDGSTVEAVGFDAGKAIMIVGKAGSGKSSLGIQIATNIMKNYENSDLYILDYEQSNKIDRVRNISGLSQDYINKHVLLLQTGIYTETVLALVKQIYDTKKKYADDIMVDNCDGLRDKNGKVIKMFPPTFVMIDSWTTMMPKADISDNGGVIDGQTIGGRTAQVNKQVLKKILQPCLEANIIPIIINQLSANMSIGPMPAESQTRFLKNTLTIPGGKSLTYLVNTIMMIDAGSKLEPTEKYKIKGFEANITLIKSRNSSGGRAAMMIFDQDEGFDNDLSMFELMRANKQIGGAGIGMYINGYNDEKFSMANLKDKLLTSPTLRSKFDALGQSLLSGSLEVSSKVSMAKATGASNDAQAAMAALDAAVSADKDADDDDK